MSTYWSMIEDSYRNSPDMKERQMFDFYESNWKPLIGRIIGEEKPFGVDSYGLTKGIYYEAWIDLTDYFIPDNYEKLRNLSFEEAARLCYDYLVQRHKIYIPLA